MRHATLSNRLRIAITTVVVAASAASAGACGLVFDTDALERGSPITPDSATDNEVDAGEESVAPACPDTGRGPKLVPVDGYCIDATEVTVADYDTFQKQTPSPLPFADPCKWVTTLRPTTFATQLTTPSRPVVDVNYCHAFHYCKWAGKHLCGSIGGGALPPGDAGITTQSNEWLRACTHGGEQRYSYGETVIAGACTNNSTKIVAVGTRDACKGPYPDLFDMLGNVGEWINACGTDGLTVERDPCYALGVERIRDEGSCWDSNELSRYWTAADLGFRCCGP
jgi:sulfatase modifying factor 1